MVTEQLKTEVANGQGKALKVLGRLAPTYRQNKPRSLSCMMRWAMEGVKGPGGSKIYLEAMRSPAGWISTPEALVRFFEQLTPTAAQSQERTLKPLPEKCRRKRSEVAAKKLESMGI